MVDSLTIVGLGESLWDVLPAGKQLGGAPLNVACHAHQLLQVRGGRGVVASRVGNDDLGDEVVDQLTARGMSTDFVQRDGAHATSTVHIVLKDDQPTYRFTPDIAWDYLELTPGWKQLARDCAAVCFGTLAQRSPQSRQTIWRFLDAAPQAIRLFDVNLRQGFYDRESIREGCRRATLVKLNEEELPIVAHELQLQAGPPESQLRPLHTEFNLDAVVYTRGPRGTLLVLADEIIEPRPVSYPAVPSADAVGAGDACAAGILVGFVLGWPPAHTADLANTLGAYVALGLAPRQLYRLRSLAESIRLLVPMPPKLIYFDLGNVLLSFSHERMCQQMADVAGVPLDLVRTAVFGGDEAHAAQISYEMGEIDTDGYFEYFCRATGTRPDRRRLERAFCDIFAPLDETWQLVRKLAAAGHRLAILSNTNSLQWQWCTDGRFPLLAAFGEPGSPFAWAVLSYEARAMKPDRPIYDVAVQRAGSPANDIFFVDDRPENVVGAKAAGLDAVQFTDVEQLTVDLRARGVAGI